VTSSKPVTNPNAINFTPDNKHAYAYSGRYGANTTPVTALDFKTQSEYIVGQFYISVALNDGAPSSSTTMSQIKFNGITISNLWAGYGGADAESLSLVNLIIPPFTEVTGSLYSDENQSDRYMTMTFTGKAYGMTETGYQ